jgi:hypothetical protein
MTASALSQLILTLAPHLPMRIRSAAWSDPTLTVAGDEWALAITSPWRIATPQGVSVYPSSPTALDDVWDLIGLDVVELEPLLNSLPVDPVLVFSDSRRLEVFCDSDWDPWYFRHDALPMTYVGHLTI